MLFESQHMAVGSDSFPYIPFRFDSERGKAVFCFVRSKNQQCNCGIEKNGLVLYLPMWKVRNVIRMSECLQTVSNQMLGNLFLLASRNSSLHASYRKIILPVLLNFVICMRNLGKLIRWLSNSCIIQVALNFVNKNRPIFIPSHFAWQ